MNPWGVILVALGIVLIMIGMTGSQHKILQVFKGIPSAAGGAASSTTKAPVGSVNSGDVTVL